MYVTILIKARQFIWSYLEKVFTIKMLLIHFVIVTIDAPLYTFTLKIISTDLVTDMKYTTPTRVEVIQNKTVPKSVSERSLWASIHHHAQELHSNTVTLQHILDLDLNAYINWYKSYTCHSLLNEPKTRIDCQK